MRWLLVVALPFLVATVFDFSLAQNSVENDATTKNNSYLKAMEFAGVSLELHFGEEKMYVSDENAENIEKEESRKIGSVYLFGKSKELDIYKANLAKCEQAFIEEQDNHKLMYHMISNEDEFSKAKDSKTEENKERSVETELQPKATDSTESIHVPTSDEIFEKSSSIVNGAMNAYWKRWQFLSHVSNDEDIYKVHAMNDQLNQRLMDLRSAANVYCHYDIPGDVRKEIQRIYGMFEHDVAKTLTLFETNVSPGIFYFTGLKEFNYISKIHDDDIDRVEFETFQLLTRNRDLNKMHLPQSSPQQLTRVIDQLKYREEFELHVGIDKIVQYSLLYTEHELTAELATFSDNLLIGRLIQKRKSIRNVNIHLLSQNALSISRPFFFDFELESVGVFRAESMCNSNIDPMKIVLAQINTWKVFKSKWEFFAFKWQHLTLETICDYNNAEELEQLYVDMETIAAEVEGLKSITLKFVMKSETRLTEIASKVCRLENKWVGYKINLKQNSISCL